LADSAYLLSGMANVRLELKDLPVPLLTGSFRGPGYNSFAFMIDSFIDECAVAAGIDPLAYRIALLANWPDTGWVKCLRVAADGAGWGATLPKGEGLGIAVANWGGFGKPGAGSTVACAARVAVAKTGAVTIKQLDLAVDCGGFLNRDAVAAQIEGGALFGVNVAMNERLTLDRGRVKEGNFDLYPIRRIADTPIINVHFDALSNDGRYAEIGECPVGPTGAAIGNAIFQASGKRLRTQPFRAHDLSWT
jgi:isoquinoline 1-oxidoreductase beta subunit